MLSGKGASIVSSRGDRTRQVDRYLTGRVACDIVRTIDRGVAQVHDRDTSNPVMMIIKSGGIGREGRRSCGRHAAPFIEQLNFGRVTLGPMRRRSDALSWIICRIWRDTQRQNSASSHRMRSLHIAAPNRSGLRNSMNLKTFIAHRHVKTQDGDANKQCSPAGA